MLVHLVEDERDLARHRLPLGKLEPTKLEPRDAALAEEVGLPVPHVVLGIGRGTRARVGDSVDVLADLEPGHVVHLALDRPVRFLRA